MVTGPQHGCKNCGSELLTLPDDPSVLLCPTCAEVVCDHCIELGKTCIECDMDIETVANATRAERDK